MAYVIRFLKDGQKLGDTPWGRDLASAKKHAQDHFLINKNSLGATSVVVIDDNDGKVVFIHP